MEISSIYLKAFYQLAKERNFTKAASSLAITQSAFSHRILNLESDLESTLVIREKHNIQLTPAGESLLRYCEKAFRMEEEFLNSMRGSAESELAGNVRIGAFSSISRSCVLPALQQLMLENPKLSVATRSVELDEVLDLLKTSNVDFIISNKDPQSKKIKSIFLGYENNVLVESKEHPFTGNYLDHDQNDITTSSYFKLKPDLEESSKGMRYLDDVYGLIDGVKLGYGRAILPLHLIKKEKSLKVLFPKTKLKVPLYLLFYVSPYQTKVEKAVLKALMGHFQGLFKK